MSASWYVIDADGNQYGDPHATEAEAMCAMVAMVHELSPHVENPYLVESRNPDGPWAYAVPTQNGRRSC